jgi:predicted HTH domain antitoxin
MYRFLTEPSAARYGSVQEICLMKLTIDIPDTVRHALERQLGQNLTQAAKEAMATAWYQAEKLSIGQAAELLGISVYEAEGFMKERHIEAPYSLEDYERDRETIERLLS